MMDQAEEPTPATFKSFGLDDRLLKAIYDLGWTRPTLIQEQGIPLGLEGKDILAKGRTGSGKTALFLIPILQKILEQKLVRGAQPSKARATDHCTCAIILAPTKELCGQILNHIQALTVACSREVRSADISLESDAKSQRSQLSERPDIVVGTPSRVLLHIDSGSINSAAIQMLVVDEADLIFSFGFEADMQKILKLLPKMYQAFLTSATLTDDVKNLKRLLLHNPVTLRLEEAQLPDSSQLTQFQIRCPNDDDRFLITYALMKLRLVRGKTILFVNSVNRGYRLKLYLQQFGIQTCVLNAELPVSSRCHVVQQFNDGIFDCLIACDEDSLLNQASTSKGAQLSFSADQQGPPRKRSKPDLESGVSRGIDFQRVSNIINFDFPKSVDSYIHRVGRTARGWNHGTALSFVGQKETPVLNKVVAALKDQMGADVLKPYQFRKEELEGFRYRSTDALKAVTTAAVREARLEEIKAEVMQSHKLRTYFAQNPRDFQVLRHDRALHVVKEQPHLQHVPEYIVPTTLRGMNYTAQLSKRKSNALKSSGPLSQKSRTTMGQKKFLKKKSDPLQSFTI